MNNPEKMCEAESLALSFEAPKRVIYRKAIDTFGAERQIRKAVEELTELSLELQQIETLKGLRRDDCLGRIAEEMADVEIMLEQVKLILNNAAEVESWKKSKLHRLEFRIEEGYYKALEKSEQD